MNEYIQKNLAYKKYVIDPKLQYFKPNRARIEKTFSEEISSSLSQQQKFIDPKFFYDKQGSELFEQICTLTEYYPTRTEIKILESLKTELASFLDESYRLVELGSGSSTKTRLILDIFDKLNDKIQYFPIDISEILTESSATLQNDYSNLHITGVIDTYEGGLEFIENFDDKNNFIIFLGSSYGNFLPKKGMNFLKKISSVMKKNDLFLIGLDMVKEKTILEKAYDDASGVTAKFNLNVLSRINDELDADFELINFKHLAKYNEKEQRIEMYLRSLVNQTVTISKTNYKIDFKQDELIHTEYSHKFTIPQIKTTMISAGFDIQKIWLDDKKYFSLTLLSKKF